MAQGGRLVDVHRTFAQRTDQPVTVPEGCIGQGWLVAPDGVDDGQSLEGFAQIERAALIVQGGGPTGLLSGRAQHLFGEVHHPAIVGVGGVELHHRELWVMANADPFVTKIAIDLKDPFKATDHQTFQVKLGRDTQIHRLIKCVVMRHEGLGGCPTRYRVQHRCFDLEKFVLVHETTNRVERA